MIQPKSIKLLFLLAVLCFTVPAWASITSERDAEGNVTFSGSGMLERQHVIHELYSNPANKVIIDGGITSIADDAFQGMEMSSVEIKSQMTTISKAFAKHECLKELVINNAVDVTIVDGAFEECDLQSLTIPSNVTQIGKNAFRQNPNLTTLTFSSGDTDLHIGFGAFWYCGITQMSIFRSLVDDYESSVYYNGTFSSTESLLAVYIGGKCNRIPGMCFKKCKNLRTLKFNTSTVINLIIGEEAFMGTALTKLQITKQVRTLGNRSFMNCKNLKEIEFEEGGYDLNIDSHVFMNEEGGEYVPSKSLTRVVINREINHTGYPGVFFNCQSLTDLELGLQCRTLENKDFENTGIRSLTMNSVMVANRTTPPEGGWAVMAPNLMAVHFGEKVTTENLKTKDFYNCTNLLAAVFENYDTYHELNKEDVFAGCTKLAFVKSKDDDIYNFQLANQNLGITETIYVPSQSVANGPAEGWSSECSLLSFFPNAKKIIFDPSVKDIPDYCMYAVDGNKTLEEVCVFNLPNVGKYAFGECSKLTTINGQVKSVAEGSFYGSGISSINVVEKVNNNGKNAFKDCINLTNVTLPDGLTIIGNDMFNGCSSLQNFTIPSKMTHIAGRAFANSGLEEIKIPESVKQLGYEAFTGCQSLTKVTLPESLVDMGTSCFSYCRELPSITIPENLSNIGNKAFEGCFKLKDVTILSDKLISKSGVYTKEDNISTRFPSVEVLKLGEKVTSIGSNAFCYSYSLKQVNATSDYAVEASAFEGCMFLTDVSSDKITSVADKGFASCTNLKRFNTHPTCLRTSETAFDGCTNLLTLQINNNDIRYIESDAYAPLADVFPFVQNLYYGREIEEARKGIWENHFFLRNVTFQKTNGVTLNAAFAGNSFLQKVSVNGHVINVKEGAFKDCSGLTNVSWTEVYNTIHKEAFSGCYSLEGVELYGCVKVGELAFNGCEALKELEFYKDLETSYWDAENASFKGCTGVTKLSVDNVTIAGNDLKTMFPNVKDVAYGNEVSLIPAEAWKNVATLATVTMSDNVTSIGQEAFMGTAISEVLLGSKINNLGNKAFANCTKLSDVQILVEDPTTITLDSGDENHPFYGNVMKNIKLNPLNASTMAYRNHEYWNKFTITCYYLTDENASAIIPDGDYYPGRICYQRATEAGNYATFCLPFDIDLRKATGFEGVYVPHDIAFYNNATQRLRLLFKDVVADKTYVNDILPANTPFIAKMNGPAEFNNNSLMVMEDWSWPSPEETEIKVYNWSEGEAGLTPRNYDIDMKFTGVYVNATAEMYAPYSVSFFTKNGGYKTMTTGRLTPYHAMLLMQSTAAVKGLDIAIFDDEATTVIKSIDFNETDNQDIYMLDGRKVQNMNQGGVYIVNGKKVLK